ncbi:MAG: hypothetical protein EBZ36_08230 [Acidobacteria bacterium]|nr:hypothetical protein [Acidobacteriota bacterium]
MIVTRRFLVLWGFGLGPALLVWQLWPGWEGATTAMVLPGVLAALTTLGIYNLLLVLAAVIDWRLTEDPEEWQARGIDAGGCSYSARGVHGEHASHLESALTREAVLVAVCCGFLEDYMSALAFVCFRLTSSCCSTREGWKTAVTGCGLASI